MSAPLRPDARRPRPTGPGWPRRPCVILVAEDDAATRAMLHDALSGAGHRVAVARGLAEAASALATVRFDLVLAAAPLGDTDRRREHAWGALERLRALAGGAPVVVATAHRPEHVADWRARGFAALLAKPLDLDDLLATVDRELTPGSAGKVRSPEDGRPSDNGGGMTTAAGRSYDLATLEQARGNAPLEVRQGLAITYQWAARAEEGLDLALTAEGRPARTVTDLLSGLGPGQRAALGTLLADAEQHLDRLAGRAAAPLVVSPRHGTGALLGLRGERDCVALRIARAHAALLREGDTLLGVRRRPSVYVLVVRDRMVVAAIRAAPAPGVRPEELRRRLPVIPGAR
jgi:CheY-like chemotaxis protein